MAAKKPGTTKATRGSVAGPNAGTAHTKAGESCNLDDDAEGESIDRLFDTPQDQWTIEQWRTLAVYLHGRHEAVVASLHKANAAHEQSLDLLTSTIGKLAAHTKALQFFEQQLRVGRMSIKAKEPRKQRGRPKKLSERQEEQRRIAFVVLAARQGPAKAARSMARVKVRQEGLDPDSSRSNIVTKLNRYTTSLTKRVSEARTEMTRQILAEYGNTEEAIAELEKLKLRLPKKSG